MGPVDLVTIHHEGAGSPSDVPRGAAGGYTIWDGTTRYTFLRDVWHSFATLNFNHVSLDICISGNRMQYKVEQHEIDLIREAVQHARDLGYVTDNPYVRAHRNSPGSSTVCPGDHAMEPLTWLAIVLACHKEAPVAPLPQTVPEFFPALPGFVSWCLFSHPTKGVACVGIDAGGHVFCEPADAYLGSPYNDNGTPKPYWVHPDGSLRHGSRVKPTPKGYKIIDTDTETYNYPEG